jgi:hypothetical protein
MAGPARRCSRGRALPRADGHDDRSQRRLVAGRMAIQDFCRVAQRAYDNAAPSHVRVGEKQVGNYPRRGCCDEQAT